jgi:hypothetical protein
MGGLFDFMGNTLSRAETFIDQQWSQRMVQIAVYSGVVFYVLSTYELINAVEKQLSNIGLKVGKDGTRLVHALIFAVFMYFGSRFILDPLVARIHLKDRHPDSNK